MVGFNIKQTGEVRVRIDDFGIITSNFKHPGDLKISLFQQTRTRRMPSEKIRCQPCAGQFLLQRQRSPGATRPAYGASSLTSDPRFSSADFGPPSEFPSSVSATVDCFSFSTLRSLKWMPITAMMAPRRKARLAGKPYPAQRLKCQGCSVFRGTCGEG